MINMITLKDAAKILQKKEPKASFFGAFEYKELYVFHMFDGEVWTEGSSLDYYMSVNKETGEAKSFNDWKETFNNPEEYISAEKNTILANKFID